MDTKYCAACGQTLPRDAFGTRLMGGLKGTPTVRCSACIAARRRTPAMWGWNSQQIGVNAPFPWRRSEGV
jgi:hypothetical protein